MNREEIHQILLDHEQVAADGIVAASMAEAPSPPEIPAVLQEDASSPEEGCSPDVTTKPKEITPPPVVRTGAAAMTARSRQPIDPVPVGAPAIAAAGDEDARPAAAAYEQATAGPSSGPRAVRADLPCLSSPRLSIARSAFPSASPAVRSQRAQSNGEASPGTQTSASLPGTGPSSRPLVTSLRARAEEAPPGSVVAAPASAPPGPEASGRTRPAAPQPSPVGPPSPRVHQDAASTGQPDAAPRRVPGPSFAADSPPAFPSFSWTAPAAPAAAPLPSRASDQIAADIAAIKTHTAEIARQGII